MKTVFYIALFLIAISCNKTKQPIAPVPAENVDTDLPAEALQFETETHDFGLLKAGEKLSYSYVFQNKGDGPIVIKDAATDCGCISAQFPQKQINQGETGVIEVTFDSSGLFGRQLKTVEILWNSKELKHLIIFAEVENNQLEIKY
ncbi:MAG TPA: hypothetical protein DER09_01430 [Prolixibacteraceae bacterium]|nr:hypothetical protein [Prolixibacteraceae bacterium]